MYLRLSSDELAIQDVFRAFFEGECSIERVRGANQLGFDADAWSRLAETGAPGMCLPENVGGGGAPLTTGAIVADLVGTYIAPLPFIEHLAASRLLASVAPDHEKLPLLASGEKIATMGLQPQAGSASNLIPAGAIADTAIVFDGDNLLLETAGKTARHVPNTADLPLASIPSGTGDLLASGEQAREAFSRARSEWQALMAVALAGVGRKAVELGVEYAKERYQFGVLIGSFQALQHGLASAITDVEGAYFLSNRAISALENPNGSGEKLAGMAFLFASEAAMTAAATSLQYHGGYGFAEEYDIQLYYRRAKGWPLQLGDPGLEYQRIADLCLPSGKVA